MRSWRDVVTSPVWRTAERRARIVNPLAVGLTPDQVLAGLSSTELERVDVGDIRDAELGVLIADRLADDDPVVGEAGVIVVTDASWRLATPFYVERSLVAEFVESHVDRYGEPLAETDVVVVDFVGRRLVVVYHDDGPMFCLKTATTGAGGVLVS